MVREIQPLEPMDQNGATPVPGVPAGLPAWPLTPLSVWTWATPVIPTFYWNVYSAEQRVKQICLEIGRIEAYLDRLVTDINKNIVYLEKYIQEVEERVAELEKRLEEEVARLDALIAQLREDLEQEIRDREAADNQLHEEISAEVADRIHGDDVLHAEISAETTARVHADDELTARISREEATRAERDNALQAMINSNTSLINGNTERIDAAEASLRRKLEQDDIVGSDRIVVTAGEDNHVSISSTFDPDFEAVEDSISRLQGALAQETQERQQDVQGLWDAVHRRIELGKVLAGPGISVQNDPDATTVTISATGGTGGGKALVAGDGIEIEQDETQATISSTLPVAPAAVSDPPEATGAYSLALGESAEATGDYSIAIGDAASAHAHHAIAIGESSVATEERTVSFAKADGEGHRLTGLVDPRDDQDAATKSYVDRVATEHGGVVYQAGEGISIEGTTISSTITQAPTLTAGEGIMLDDSTPGELEISAAPVAPPVEAPITSTDGTLGLSIDQDTMEVTDGKLAVKPAALTGLNPNYGFLQNAMYPSAQINAGELFGFLKRTSGTANGQLLPTTLGTSRDLTLRHHSESFYKTGLGTYGGGWISPTDAQDTADLVTYGSATGISWDEAQQGKAVTDCRMKVMNLKLVYWAKDGEESNTTYADYEAFKLFEQRTFTKMTEERGVWDKPYYRVAKEDKEGRVLKAVSFDFLLFYDLWVSSELLRFSGE